MLIGAITLVAAMLWHFHQRSTPRAKSRRAAEHLAAVLVQPPPQDQSASRDPILNLVAVPLALRSKTPWEQSYFIRGALQGELSEKGLEVLQRVGVSGSLKDVFPEEADTWASASGVKPEDCLAYRAETNGIRAELVFTSNDYRIVRCNDVRRLETLK